jgi:hypothetical protein
VFERLLLRMPDSPNTSLRFATAQECLDQLNDWYGDRHRQARAYTEFENLIQKFDESFEDFLTRFQECSAYLGLAEDQEMQKLQHKLNARYGQRINDGTFYASMKDIVRRGDALDAHFIFQDGQKKAADKEKNRHPQKNNNSSGVRPSSGNQTVSRTTSSTTVLPKLTDELRQKLRSEGRCFRCREKGHNAFNCPKNNRVTEVNQLAILPSQDSLADNEPSISLESGNA